MKSFLEALNRPAEAFQKGNRVLSWALVAFTIFMDSVFAQVLGHFFGVGKPALDALKMLKITGFGVLSYLFVCLAFFAVGKCFGSKAVFSGHLGAWGLTYFPTAICSVVVAVTEAFFYVFWNNSVWGIVVNILFVGILIWKAILYCVYLREFAGLKGVRFFGAFIAMGVVIVLLAWLNGYVGLLTPVL